EGTVGNLQALREGRADVAFVRGGSVPPDPDADADIMSLGALFYEPIWLFYRPAALQTAQPPGQPPAAEPPRLHARAHLRGLRLNVDQAGSGVPDLMHRLLSANGLRPADSQLSHLPPDTAAQALRAGQLDALVLITAPESPEVQRLLQEPGVA